MFEVDGEYSDVSLSREDLRETIADGANFTDCRFHAVNFSGASMARTSFERCTFSDCDVSNVDLSDTTLDTVAFRGVKMLGSSFAEATIRSLQASACVARLVSFFQASLRNTTLIDCDLTEGDFRGGRLVDVALVRCDLSSVSIGGAKAQRVDARGSIVDGSFSLADCEGFVLGTDQLLALARALARSVGAQVDDDEPPGLDELPGAREVAALVDVDPEVARRGLQEARERLAGDR